MRGWIDLPVEIRHKCINRMSILSSMSLRQCSKYDQQVVDSMHLNIPRIRIAEKRERVLIVVYTGVQTFLRMEFRKGDKHNETVMYRSENTTKNPQMKKISNKMPKDMIYSVLKSICVNRKVKIGTFEWLIEQGKKNEWNRSEFFSKLNISPTQIASNCVTPTENCARSAVQVKVSTDGEFSMRDPIPQEIFYTNLLVNSSPPTEFNLVHMIFGKSYDNLIGSPEILRPFYQINGKFQKMTSIVSFPLIREDQLEVVRQILEKIDEKKVDGVVVERFSFCDDREAIVCSSPCGVWAQLVEIGQNHFKLDNFSCGMGIGCKIHEPFEYWYHSQLPRRLIDEPFWSGSVDQVDRIGNRVDGITIKDDHLVEFRKFPQSKVEQMKMIQETTAFITMSQRQTGENSNREEEDVEDSEDFSIDVEESEESEESEDSEDLEDISDLEDSEDVELPMEVEDLEDEMVKTLENFEITVQNNQFPTKLFISLMSLLVIFVSYFIFFLF